MKTATFFLVIVAFLSSSTSLVQETLSHWLIGRWGGIVDGYSGNSALAGGPGKHNTVSNRSGNEIRNFSAWSLIARCFMTVGETVRK